jgi:preprotein translocase subunit SecA
LDLSPDNSERLIKVLQGGVPHQVLNARKHDEESKIIAKAGAFGGVTIATNMAGRGVDIKLGGDLDEEVLGDTNRVLAKLNHDAYNMNHQERLNALQKTTPEDWSIYEPAVRAFLQYMKEMEQVRELGGLHVVGSERHEARRIDNQLRGRAARQGDPGSSRFYLALEDELMRLFGGQQVTGLMTRLNLDESLPIESNIVGRLVEQSQQRVEGSNFDVRKHLLEYDDVLNSQRKRIYQQRDRVFTKEDLSEDVSEMLRSELQQRIPKELKNEEGPWKLVAYLDEIQPPILYEDLAYPSFSLRLLMEELLNRRPEQGGTVSQLRAELLNLGSRAWETEREHLLRSFQQLMDRAAETMESQQQERFDALDTFFETLPDRTGEDGQPVRAQDLSEELGLLLRVSQFRMTPDHMRKLENNPEALREDLRALVDENLLAITISRVAGAIERRLGESLNVRAAQCQKEELVWDDIASFLMQESERLMQRQYDRMFGDGGQVARDIDPYLEKLTDYTDDDKHLLMLLGIMMEGVRMVFDRRTHRQGFQRTRRLNYSFLGGQLLNDHAGDEVSEWVVKQLEGAQEVLRKAWGRFEWQRLSQNNIQLGQLDERLKSRLAALLGEEQADRLFEQPLETLTPEEREQVQDGLGWYDQNEAWRSLLLSVISELWVDYLTRVEALRVSIGLEAYAQRDPLVQYKGRASEMFQELLAEVRMGVISRMFTFQPRKQTPSAEAQRAEGPAAGSADGGTNGGGSMPVAAGQAQADGGDVRKKKRKRH